MLLSLSVAAFLLAGCAQRLPSFRYRLTVDVLTPEGMRTGSGVVEVATVDQGKGFPGPEAGGVRRAVRGQAVIIETSPKHYIFALLGKGYLSDYAAGLPVALLRRQVGSGNHPIGPNDDPVRTWLPYDRFHERLVADHHVWPVPKTTTAADGRKVKELWPDLVTFGDPNYPSSVRRVEPSDVAIQRVTLQVIDEPVTEGIRSILPWLSDSAARSLKPQRGVLENTPAATVTHGDLFRPTAL